MTPGLNEQNDNTKTSKIKNCIKEQDNGKLRDRQCQQPNLRALSSPPQARSLTMPKRLIPTYVGNVFVQNVSGLRKYVTTQDMSDMSQTCHIAFLNVAQHLPKSTLINVATMTSKI